MSFRKNPFSIQHISQIEKSSLRDDIITEIQQLSSAKKFMSFPLDFSAK